MVPENLGVPLRETGMPGNLLGRIKGAKYRFDLQFVMYDFY